MKWQISATQRQRVEGSLMSPRCDTSSAKGESPIVPAPTSPAQPYEKGSARMRRPDRQNHGNDDAKGHGGTGINHPIGAKENVIPTTRHGKEGTAG